MWLKRSERKIHLDKNKNQKEPKFFSSRTKCRIENCFSKVIENFSIENMQIAFFYRKDGTRRKFIFFYIRKRQKVDLNPSRCK